MMRKLFKSIGIVLASLLGLLIATAAVLYFIGGTKLSKKYDVPVETISIPSDPTTLQRGEHLVVIFLCTRCHSEDLSGRVYFEAPGLLSSPTPRAFDGCDRRGNHCGSSHLRHCSTP